MEKETYIAGAEKPVEGKPLTKELLRKRAEHNEGMLSTLEEISLHQQDLTRIQNLDVYCRHLRILYLQNNIIERMEGVHKLKELEYINCAVNNISLIENIRGCECLQKLDMTLNFIDIEDLEESIDNLCEIPDFRELYLLGNPCTDWPHWKDYCVARLLNLGRLDGDEVTKSWRLKAQQNLKKMEQQLMGAARQNIEKKILADKEGTYNPNGYTKEFRRECYLEQQQRDVDSKKKAEEGSMFKEYNEFYDGQKDQGPPPVYNKNGSVRQVNQGKYEWRFDETPDKTAIIFEIKVPKHMQTQHMNVDLNPDYIRLDIKERITQLSLPENVLVEKSKVQRSTTTGVLQLTMPKANLSAVEAQQMRITRRMEQRDADKKLRALEKTQLEAKEKAEKDMKAQTATRMAKVEDYEKKDFLIRETELDDEKSKRLAEKKKKFDEEFVIDFDESEVPPLE